MIFGSKASRQKLLPQHSIAEGYLSHPCLLCQQTGEFHPKISINSPHMVDLGHNFARTLSNYTCCAFYIPPGHPIHTGLFFWFLQEELCHSTVVFPGKQHPAPVCPWQRAAACSLPPPGQIWGQGHSTAMLKDLL